MKRSRPLFLQFQSLLLDYMGMGVFRPKISPRGPINRTLKYVLSSPPFGEDFQFDKFVFC